MARDSLVHRLDPRTKVVCVTLLMASVFLLNHWSAYLVLSSVVVLAAVLAKLRWQELSQGVVAVSVLMFISFMLQLVFTPGEVLLQVGPLFFTREGLFAGLTLSGRLAFLATLSALMGFTTTATALADCIYLLLKPLQRLKIPSRRVSLVLGVCMRFVPTILDQGEQILKAQQARGIDFSEGPLLKRAKRLLAVFLPLLSACLQRADELALAMDARGYRMDAPRTQWQTMRLDLRDWGALGLISLVFVTILSQSFG